MPPAERKYLQASLPSFQNCTWHAQFSESSMQKLFTVLKDDQLRNNMAQKSQATPQECHQFLLPETLPRV